MTPGQVLNALKAAGIPDQRLQSSGLQVDARYSGDMQEKIVGFRATGQVTVTIDDISKVGAVIDAARGAGANQIQPVQWTLKNQASSQRDALGEAAQDGIAQAGALAKGAGVGVGRLISMSTETQGPQ
ncbi:MAG: SIMPL domain-containing protein, partial [Bradyrhizobium sp.]|nr:SIMPL domain-containing protein [Bradyrhizobium sp.]